MTTLFKYRDNSRGISLDTDGDLCAWDEYSDVWIAKLPAEECYEFARQLIASAYAPSFGGGPDHFYNALQSLNEWAAELEAEKTAKERADAIWALCDVITPAEVFFGVTPGGDQILMTREEFERERPKHMELVTKAYDAGARAENLKGTVWAA